MLRHKRRVPPGAAALAAADALRRPSTTDHAEQADRAVVIDLDTYARAATGRNTLT